MTKSPDREAMPRSASPAEEEGGNGTGEPGDLGDDQDLALEVEVEPPEPTPEERIAELEAKQKETHDRYLRAVAEADNTRKRTRKEVDDARAEAQARVLREMLPVLDNLERAMNAAGGAEAPVGSDGHGIVEGVRLVVRQFAQALERCGVTPVAALGASFDPTQHEAVSQVETADAPAGTVVDVLQTGYRLRDRLLRPALVVVAKAPPAVLEPPDGGGGNGADRDDAAGPNGHDPDAA
jgi:molecular chaperone GrpE